MKPDIAIRIFIIHSSLKEKWPKFRHARPVALLILGSALLLSAAACRKTRTLPAPSPPCRDVPAYLADSSRLRVVGVFTTWSLASQAQWSRFLKQSALQNPQNVRFFAVFTDPDRFMVDEWVRSEKPPFTVIHDPAFSLCGHPAREVPLTYFLDAQNRLCRAYPGHVTSDVLARQIREALHDCAR